MAATLTTTGAIHHIYIYIFFLGGGWIRLIVGFQPLMVISPTTSWIRWCMQVYAWWFNVGLSCLAERSTPDNFWVPSHRLRGGGLHIMGKNASLYQFWSLTHDCVYLTKFIKRKYERSHEDVRRIYVKSIVFYLIGTFYILSIVSSVLEYCASGVYTL